MIGSCAAEAWVSEYPGEGDVTLRTSKPRTEPSEAARHIAAGVPWRGVLAALALVSCLATDASGQERVFDFQAGGGVTSPVGSTTSRFETGWHLTGGAGWRSGGHLGLRLDYTQSRQRLVGSALPEAFVEGQHRVHALELDARWTVDPEARVPIELLAGPGIYLRRTEITNVSRYTPGPSICDPWLQVCAVGPVSPDQILGDRSSTDLGFNLGVAVEVPIWRSVRLLLDLRWRYVWGDTYGLPGEASRRSSAHDVPLTFAIRF